MATRDESVERTLEQIPDEKIYLDSDDPWAPKMLDLEGTLQLLGMIGDVIDEIGTGGLASGELRVARLIRSLKKESLLQLISLATKQPGEWVEEHFNFVKGTKALLAFWKMNGLGELLGELGLGLGGSEEEQEEEQEEEKEEES